jgi:malate dehydrogenase (oxaloacetate-decarboxylating)
MTAKEIALQKHREWAGKLEIKARCDTSTREALAVAYTPGVAEPCLAIAKDVNLSYKYTRRWNTVAVVTDGTAVLGLGDIGPEAAMPVMEGKSVLFKSFAGVDAFPLCIRSKDVDTIVNTVAMIAGSFGGINLEDISAPRCFEIERRLKEICDIPVFHDDQHGTAIVTAAAMINAARATKRVLAGQRVVICGAGAAGIATARLLLGLGISDIILTDRQGALYIGRDAPDSEKSRIAGITNPRNIQGALADAMEGADVFIGLSGPGVVTPDLISSMAGNPIVFAMSNPIPEIMPSDAKAAGASVVGTGRSDFPNQINNVLAFPGMFRGALDVRASDINAAMNLAAAEALAHLVPDNKLTPEYILPGAWDPRVGPAVAKAVGKAARATGVARL